MYNVIPKEINYRTVHSKLLVNQMKLLKKCLLVNDPKGGRKEKHRETKNRENKQKIGL